MPANRPNGPEAGFLGGFREAGRLLLDFRAGVFFEPALFFAAEFADAVDFFAGVRLEGAFLALADLPAGRLAADFLAAGFLAAGFLAAGFFAEAFFAAGFLAVDLPFCVPAVFFFVLVI